MCSANFLSFATPIMYKPTVSNVRCLGSRPVQITISQHAREENGDSGQMVAFGNVPTSFRFGIRRCPFFLCDLFFAASLHLKETVNFGGDRRIGSYNIDTPA